MEYVRKRRNRERTRETERRRWGKERREKEASRERTNQADIALEFARRVYAIFTLDLIFWRRPSLSQDRYMSHSHTRAARIKTSKRSQREFLIPSPARFLCSPCRPPPPRFSLPHQPVCHHTWYTLLFYQPLPFTSSLFASFYSLGPRDGIQEDEESKGLAHNRFSLFLVIALSDSLTTNCRPNNMLTCSI